MVSKDKQVGENQRLPRSRSERREETTEVLANAISSRGDSVVECPARDYEVVAHNQEHRHKARSTKPAPALTNLCKGVDRVTLRVVSNGELRNKERKTQKQDTAEVDDDKRTTTVLGGDVGETPDVAEADCRACSSKDGRELTAEATTFCCLLSHCLAY